MKLLKIIGVILLILIIGAASFYIYFQSNQKPTYSGELSLTGLEEPVEVFYTEYGVPHIYAQSSKDAYYAFGYVHAQDRLWQMDLLRHVGSGRLSELFGPDLISTDKFLRTMGLGGYSKQSAEAYLSRNHESLELVQAYLAGINTYIENNPKPLEHTVLGIEIEPFTEENVFEVLTYMAFSFQNAYKTDPLLTELAAKLDSSYLEDLMIYSYPEETVIRNFDSRFSLLSKEVSRVMSDMKVPEFIGSNSWVLSGSKTETGKVILANDPHIAFSQPAVWYEAHLVMPEAEYYGYHIAGCPFPPILHTEKLANGLTMFENDDMDFYIEEIHPEDSNVYRYKDDWHTIVNTEEVIKVKGAPDSTFTLRYTNHGPIVSDILKNEPMEDIVSMYWVTTNHDNYTVDALYDFTRAKSIDDIEKAAGKIHGPGLNIMYGDSEGNVAWWAAGKLIQRQNELTSKTFYDGANSSNDPDEFYSFEKNPHAINPPWGYTYSANNQPDTVDGILYSGYYLPDDRGERITELLDVKNDFGVEEVKSMMLDSHSKTFESIKGILLHSVKDTEESALLTELINWDLTFKKDDFRPVVFQKWIYEILKNALMDEMGEDLWDTYKGTHTYKVAIEHLVKNESSKWWDDVNTEETETRTQILQESFDDAIQDLKEYWGEDFRNWSWGDGHTLTHGHAMGTALSFLNTGPFAMSGGNEVINNLGFTYTGEKHQNISFGPSTRRIVDFSDVRNNSWSILPTGQSGNYFSPHYADQADMYANGEFRKMMMNESEIRDAGKLLKLSPK